MWWRIGARLPGTFCQLLSLVNGEDLLRRFSNCDNPIPFSELGGNVPLRWGVPLRWAFYEPIQHKILPFMIENQGVCTWALPLDQGDDPPVLIEVDSRGTPEWEQLAPSLSIWLECQVSDFAAEPKGALGAQAPGLDAAGLAMLRSNFKEGHNHIRLAWGSQLPVLECTLKAPAMEPGGCMRLVHCPSAGRLVEGPARRAVRRLRLIEALYGLDDVHEAFLCKWRAGAPTA